MSEIHISRHELAPWLRKRPLLVPVVGWILVLVTMGLMIPIWFFALITSDLRNARVLSDDLFGCSFALALGRIDDE